MNPDNKDQALRRLFMVANCRTQVELAAILGIRQSSISDAQKRNAVPAEWLIKLLRLKGVNPDWILAGIEPKFLGPTTEPPKINTISIVAVKPPAECSAQELVTELVRRALADL